MNQMQGYALLIFRKDVFKTRVFIFESRLNFANFIETV